MAKRKKLNKLPDLKEELGALKEQEGEPVVGKLEEVEVKVGEVGELAEPVKELKTVKLEKITPIYKPVIKMPPTSEIFSIKDQGNSKLVIKKDGTRLTIPK